MMKAKIKSLVPAPIWEALRNAAAPLRRGILTRIALNKEFRADRDRYRRYMLADNHLVPLRLEGVNLEAQLTKDYHRIEKGLALSAPRRPFGVAVDKRLTQLLPSMGNSDPVREHVLSAQSALAKWNSEGVVDDVVSPIRASETRGIDDPERFFHSRHSVRNFSDSSVSQALLDKAVEMAIRTPSVCNRQSWRVRFYSGEEVKSILSHQSGNTGFSEHVPSLALITVESRYFAGIGERNQAWIEGGLFSMSLVWALHALGVDSCMLNMSVTNKRASLLRTSAGLEESELIVMMIAIGYGRPEHRRARSPRKRVNEIVLRRGMYLEGMNAGAE